MLRLVSKLLVGPTVVFFATQFMRDVFYSSDFAPIATGIVFGLSSYLLDNLLLGRGTFLMSTALDLFAAATVVYLSQYFFPGSAITLYGALVTGLILALTEIPQHLWLPVTQKND